MKAITLAFSPYDYIMVLYVIMIWDDKYGNWMYDTGVCVCVNQTLFQREVNFCS